MVLSERTEPTEGGAICENRTRSNASVTRCWMDFVGSCLFRLLFSRLFRFSADISKAAMRFRLLFTTIYKPRNPQARRGDRSRRLEPVSLDWMHTLPSSPKNRRRCCGRSRINRFHHRAGAVGPPQLGGPPIAEILTHTSSRIECGESGAVRARAGLMHCSRRTCSWGIFEKVEATCCTVIVVQLQFSPSHQVRRP